MNANAPRIAWTVFDMVARIDVVVFLAEADAIAFARAHNATNGPVPRFQVERDVAVARHGSSWARKRGAFHFSRPAPGAPLNLDWALAPGDERVFWDLLGGAS